LACLSKQTGPKLSNILDYLEIPILTIVLTDNFCCCSYTWAVQIIRGVFPLYTCCWFSEIRLISLLGGVVGNLLSVYSDDERPGDSGSGVFIAKEADAVGVKVLGNNTSVRAETSLVAFLEDFHTW